MVQTALAGLALAAPWASLAWLTAVGARRRGNGRAVVLLSGTCFPVTWAVWYVRDEMPLHGRAE